MDVLFESPKHPYTRALIDAIPVPDPRVAPKGAPLRGEVPSLLNPPSGCVFHPRCVYSEDECGNRRPTMREFGGSRVACHRAGEINL